MSELAAITTPEQVRRIWGDDAVFCNLGHSPSWHHKDFHRPARWSWRVDAMVAWRGLQRDARGLAKSLLAGAMKGFR